MNCIQSEGSKNSQRALEEEGLSKGFASCPIFDGANASY